MACLPSWYFLRNMAQAKLERRNYTAAFETLGKKGHLKREERGAGARFGEEPGMRLYHSVVVVRPATDKTADSCSCCGIV